MRCSWLARRREATIDEEFPCEIRERRFLADSCGARVWLGVATGLRACGLGNAGDKLSRQGRLPLLRTEAMQV